MKRILAILATMIVAGVSHAGHPHCAVVQQQVVAPVDYYYTVQPQQSAPFVYGGDVDAILRARKELLRLESGLNLATVQALQQLSGSQQNLRQALLAPPPALTTPPAPQPMKTHCETPGVPVPPPPAADDPVSAIFTAKCAKCHGANSTNGFAIQTQLDATRRWEIVGRVATENMPPKGHPPLSIEEVSTIERWAKGLK